MGVCNRFTISRISLLYLIPRRDKKMIDDHWNATGETLARRIESGSNRRDFMTPVLEVNVDSKTLRPIFF